jgi:hypothetical protein
MRRLGVKRFAAFDDHFRQFGRFRVIGKIRRFLFVSGASGGVDEAAAC